MATAADYDQGAIDFRRGAVELERLAGNVAGSLPGSAIGQNPVRAALDIAVVASTRALVEAADRFREHATTCARRAEICRDLDAAWARWEAALAEHGSEMGARMFGGAQEPASWRYRWYTRSTP